MARNIYKQFHQTHPGFPLDAFRKNGLIGYLDTFLNFKPLICYIV